MDVFQPGTRAWGRRVDMTNLETTSFLWVIDFSLSVRHNFHLMRCQLSSYAVKLSTYGYTHSCCSAAQCHRLATTTR